MNKKLVFIFILCIYYSCKSIPTSEQKRKALIEQAIQAIEKNDTTLLFSILDTARTFNFFGKDNVLFKIAYAHDRLIICGASIKDDAFTVHAIPGNFKRYIVSFCRGKNNEIIYDSFDFLFTFADFENDEKISRIDISIYRRKEVE